jgi:hypothetical protein
MIRAGCFAAGLLLSSTVAQAQKPEHAKGGKHEAGTEAASTATGIFTSAERRTISDYFAHHPYTPKPLPPRSGAEITVVGDKVVLVGVDGVVGGLLESLFH